MYIDIYILKLYRSCIKILSIQTASKFQINYSILDSKKMLLPQDVWMILIQALYSFNI